jgi:hypothetical protein
LGGNEPVTGVTECNRIPVTPQDDGFSRVAVPSEVLCNCVTLKKEIEIEIEEEWLIDFSTVVDAEKIHETPENPGYNGYTVTDTAGTTAQQGLEGVTEISENPVTVTEISVTEVVSVTDQPPLPIYQRTDGSFVAVEEVQVPELVNDKPAEVTGSSNLATIEVGDVVCFMNPHQLEPSRKFEGIDLNVVRLMSKLSLAVCVLPDGTEKNFPLDALVVKE